MEALIKAQTEAEERLATLRYHISDAEINIQAGEIEVRDCLIAVLTEKNRLLQEEKNKLQRRYDRCEAALDSRGWDYKGQPMTSASESSDGSSESESSE